MFFQTNTVDSLAIEPVFFNLCKNFQKSINSYLKCPKNWSCLKEYKKLHKYVIIVTVFYWKDILLAYTVNQGKEVVCWETDLWKFGVKRTFTKKWLWKNDFFLHFNFNFFLKLFTFPVNLERRNGLIFATKSNSFLCYHTKGLSYQTYFIGNFTTNVVYKLSYFVARKLMNLRI